MRTFNYTNHFKQILTIVVLTIATFQFSYADHIWGAIDLELCEDAPGSNSYDVEFTGISSGATTDNFYYEIYLVEGDCPADDDFAVDVVPGGACAVLAGASLGGGNASGTDAIL